MSSSNQFGHNAYKKSIAQGEILRLERIQNQLNTKLIQAKNDLRLLQNTIKSKAISVAYEAAISKMITHIFNPIGGLLTTFHDLVKSWNDLVKSLTSQNSLEKNITLQVSRMTATLATIVPTIGQHLIS